MIADQGRVEGVANSDVAEGIGEEHREETIQPEAPDDGTLIATLDALMADLRVACDVRASMSAENRIGVCFGLSGGLRTLIATAQELLRRENAWWAARSQDFEDAGAA